MNRLKVICAALALVGSSVAFGQSAVNVIQCDPNATGNTTYPNVSCTSNGYINVNATVSAGATTGAAANGSAVSGNPVLVAGYDGTDVRTVKTDTSGQIIVSSVATPISVVGAANEGTAPGNGPIRIAGWDGTDLHTITTDTSGHLIIGTGAASIGTVTPTSNTLRDGSGTITAGGTAQTLDSARTRNYLFIQNLSSANLYINFTSAASAGSGSILLLPNSSFSQEGSFVSSQLISIFGATTGQAFTYKDF